MSLFLGNKNNVISKTCLEELLVYLNWQTVIKLCEDNIQCFHMMIDILDGLSVCDICWLFPVNKIVKLVDKG